MKPTSIDLFCGCGGFSLGMEKAGFTTLAAIDANPQAIKVYRKNFRRVPHILEKDLTKFGPEDLEELICRSTVDVIVGGPPCQGFSHARRRDGTNNGPKTVPDSRRYLYQEFIRYVGHFKPKAFVMENVLGIKSAGGGEYFRRVQEEARALGYRVHGQIVKATDYGVPQKRIRQLIIGTRKDIPEVFRDSFMPRTHADKSVTLGEAIDDLPVIRANSGAPRMAYDMVRRVNSFIKYGSDYLEKVIQVGRSTVITGHVSRPHSERDLRDFQRLREGENSKLAMKRGVEFEFPYSKKVFIDRYTRQHRNRPCSTIVAHMSKDGLMFIHPTQNRSLTPREAARVQSFPDWFEFCLDRTPQYRVIGNAVPPLIGKAVGKALLRYFRAAGLRGKDRLKAPSPAAAVDCVGRLTQVESRQILQKMPREEFLEGWICVGRLFPGLHPAAALENGKTLSHQAEADERIAHLAVPYYRQSGWPAQLVPIAREAWRRHRNGQLKESELFGVFA